MKFYASAPASKASILACTLLLLACGGGGGGNDQKAEPSNLNAEPFSTVSSYATGRNESGLAPGQAAVAPLASTEDIAKAASATMEMADSALLNAADSDSIQRVIPRNMIVVPPLDVGRLNLMASAAQGDSLSQRQGLFPADQLALMWRSESPLVSRKVWGQERQPFQVGFLDAINPRSGATWAGADEDFADGGVLQDKGMQKAFSDWGLSLSKSDLTAQTRFFAMDEVNVDAPLVGAAPFNGLFLGPGYRLYSVPMVRITQAVSRYSANGFKADVLETNGLILVTMQFSDGKLHAAASGWGAEIKAAVEAVEAADGAKTEHVQPGSMLLPVAALELPMYWANVSESPGEYGKVYDPVHADLRGLDGTGGAYARTVYTAARLSIDASSVKLRAGAGTAFDYSNRNVFASKSTPPSGGSNDGPTHAGLIMDLGDGFLPPGCPTPDLSSFFLVILDAKHNVVAVAGIEYVGGEQFTCPSID